ncbi:MAG: DEAD/DEAH box helicase [Bacteroidetes bacterium]|nr:MAG: DEAD/DEAH box helicase [Bacteroidota bacterium]
MNFTDFGFDPRVMEGIDSLGFTIPTPIQEQAIPVIAEGKDLIGSAQTGTGKTAAFLLPITDHILRKEPRSGIKALVIVPTRELAVQIDQHMEGLSYFTSVSSLAIYGGTDGATFTREKTALISGVDVVVCTPGRMIAHLNMGYVDFSSIKTLVLDEADRMLDMGFYDDIMKIISHVPEVRQTLLFSATIPSDIKQLAKKVLHDPFEINIALSKPAEKILQLAYSVYDTQKLPLVKYLLGTSKGRTILIFCSTKSSTKLLSRELQKAGLEVQEIHSDLEQKEREKVMRGFRNKEIQVLVATDVVSRGIDVENIDLVLNYDVPNDAEDYIHRIGRTARAEASGVAITFINPAGQWKFAEIEKLLGKPVHKGTVPVQFGEAPEYNPKKSGGFRRSRR